MHILIFFNSHEFPPLFRKVPAVWEAAIVSKELMNAELGLGMAALSAATVLENMTGFNGPVTHEKVVQAHALFSESAAHFLKAEQAAPDEASALAMRSFWAAATMQYPRQHALPEFSPVVAFGEGGAHLRDTIERCAFPSRLSALSHTCSVTC